MNSSSNSPDQEDQKKSTSLPATVKLLSWASFLNDVASEMIYTQVPRFFLEVLGGTKAHLGFMEGAAEAVSSLVKLWSGAKTDQTGKRKGLVVAGYTIAAAMRPLIGMVTAPWQLIGLRVGDRIGKGIRTSPRDALIADVTDTSNRGRAFGFHRGMDHLGAAVGPLLAAAFLWFWPESLRTLFLLAAIPGIAVLGLVLTLRETAREADSDSVESSKPQQKLRLSLEPFDRDFKIFLAALLVFTIGNSTDMFLLVRARETGVADYQLPLLWCLFHVVKSLGNMVSGRFVDQIGPRPLLISGWLVYALVYALFAIATSPWQSWLLFVGYAIYYSLTEPSEKTLVANLVGPDNKGLAFGWFNLVIGIGALPASLLFGVIYQAGGAIVAFGMGAVLALFAVGLTATLKLSKGT